MCISIQTCLVTVDICSYTFANFITNTELPKEFLLFWWQFQIHSTMSQTCQQLLLEGGNYPTLIAKPSNFQLHTKTGNASLQIHCFPE